MARPREWENPKTCSVVFEEGTLAVLDELRGPESRSKYIGRLIEEKLIALENQAAWRAMIKVKR